MYQVTIFNDGEATVIHNAGADPTEPHLYSCMLTQGSPGEIDSLEFIILPNNPGYDLLASRTTFIQVTNTKTDVVEFYGRVLTITPEMQDTGLIYKTVVCEDRLGYLCDSVQPFLTKTTYYDDGSRTGVEQFLDLVLDNHNSQVEDYKKIYRGNVTFSTNTDNVTKGLTYESTWDTISQKLLTDLGGEIQLREDDDGLLYLDYVEMLGDYIDTVSIAFGENMRSVTREIDQTSVITRLIPLGAHLESDEGDTDDYVTIASVNNGVLYIDDEKAQETYGIVVGTVSWDDVTVPSNLLAKAKDWLTQQSLSDSITVSALDLSLIGLTEDSLERYNYYRVVNDKIGLDSYYRVIKKTINICDPSDTTFELGEKSRSLAATIITTQQQAQASVTEYADAVKRLNNKLDSSSGLYVTTEEQEDGSTIYYMHNMPTLAESDIVWKLTAEAFGISTDGGASYPYGFTVTGDVIAERLYSVGIDATYITSGALTIKDGGGNVIFCADADNKSLTINTSQFVLTSSGAQFSGELSAATGTFAGELNAATGSFSGTITANDGAIGGWYISSSRIRSSSTIYMGASEAGLMLINESSAPYIYIQDANGTGTFYANRDGSVYCKGSISATYLTATNSVYINNSSGTAKVALNAPEASFGNALNIGGGFTAIHLASTGGVYTAGPISAGEDGSGTITCGELGCSDLGCGNISITGSKSQYKLIPDSSGYMLFRCIYKGDSYYDADTDTTVSSGTTMSTLTWDGLSGTFTSQIISTSANAFRCAYGDYGVILRNDGSNFYILLTDSKKSVSGSWNSLRPFAINLASGAVTIATAFTVSGFAYFTGVTSAGTSADYAMLSSNDRQLRYSSSSSERYKIVYDELTESDILPLYDIPTYWFEYKDGYLVEDDERCGKAMPGFIAERWDEVLPIAVNHKDGLAEMWNSNIVVPLTFEMVKHNHNEIEELKSQIAELQAQIAVLQASA